jgi:hypothetical protein
MVEMKSFKQFIREGTYPNWLRVTVGMMAMKVNKLSDQIANETDSAKQNVLIAKQNKLIASISGLGVGIGTDDKILLKKIKAYRS